MSRLAKAATKWSNQSVHLEAQWPLLELILNTQAEIEPLTGQVGSKIIDPSSNKRSSDAAAPGTSRLPTGTANSRATSS